jgi:hypothetical protein
MAPWEAVVVVVRRVGGDRGLRGRQLDADEPLDKAWMIRMTNTYDQIDKRAETVDVRESG